MRKQITKNFNDKKFFSKKFYCSACNELSNPPQMQAELPDNSGVSIIICTECLNKYFIKEKK